MTGVSKCQQRGNLKDNGYIIPLIIRGGIPPHIFFFTAKQGLKNEPQ
ncbi:hypothetical protein ACK3F5_16940 [Photorhabdus asymbiotica UENP]